MVKNFGLFVFLISGLVEARPIDIHGDFGVGATTITNYRRTKLNSSGTAGNGNQFIDPATGSPNKASFQDYRLRLRPQIIVNDSITFKSEITTGHANGGFLGDSPNQRKSSSPNFGNALYFQNLGSGAPNMTLSQFYAELFSATATYYLGRSPFHWGLGAMYNSESSDHGRFISVRDGITAKFPIGNFEVAPFWYKNNSTGNLTHLSNTKAYGFSLLYDNVQRDLTFGLLFNRQKIEAYNTYYTSSMTNLPLGRSNVKLTDFYFKKIIGRAEIEVEIPLISGDLGNVYTSNSQSKYKASAILVESKYNLDDFWTAGVNFGQVSGDDGPGSSYKALFLHPNFQKGMLLFKYNMRAINDSTLSPFDSYIVNTRYLHMYGRYTTDAWVWGFDFLTAKAIETIGPGESYDHGTNTVVNASFSQESSLGYELNGHFVYKWNANMHVKFGVAYHFVGDYYAFNNTATPTDTTNVYSTELNTMISF